MGTWLLFNRILMGTYEIHASATNFAHLYYSYYFLYIKICVEIYTIVSF